MGVLCNGRTRQWIDSKCIDFDDSALLVSTILLDHCDICAFALPLPVRFNVPACSSSVTDFLRAFALSLPSPHAQLNAQNDGAAVCDTRLHCQTAPECQTQRAVQRDDPRASRT